MFDELIETQIERMRLIRQIIMLVANKMKLSKILKIVIGLCSFFIVVIAVTSIFHPIVLSWLSGGARSLGKPVNAIVYTNGKVNSSIKVYHTDKYWDSNEKTNIYLLSLDMLNDLEMLRFIHIDLKEKWIGRPVAATHSDYDSLFGCLFESDHTFIPFQNDMKGFDFDPKLSFNGKKIKFNLPPAGLIFDSIRIELK